ncbi:MAG: pseudouridine synthase [Anaerolineaceae bacterium]|nr:pseudouridine synthase [Anaerolineaceae bacterium]
MEERIQKILARVGYGSRRSCEDLIVAGRVLVNGQKAELGQKADQAKDKIEVDRTAIPQTTIFRYVVYNKPRFVLCDKVMTGDGRRTVFNMVPGGEELSVIGRLDFESEGLVILSNDGDMVNRLTHPRYEHEKEYKVLLSTRPDAKQLDAWRRGIILEDGHKTSGAEVRIDTNLGKGAWLRIIMKEGHKRQIRETAKTLGLFAIRILRIRIGSLPLGTLKPGEYRDLTESEVAALRENKNVRFPTRAKKHVFNRSGGKKNAERPDDKGERPQRSGARSDDKRERPQRFSARSDEKREWPPRSAERSTDQRERRQSSTTHSDDKREKPQWSTTRSDERTGQKRTERSIDRTSEKPTSRPSRNSSDRSSSKPADRSTSKPTFRKKRPE